MPSLFDIELVRLKALGNKDDTSADNAFNEHNPGATSDVYTALTPYVAVPIPDANVTATHQKAHCYTLLSSYYEGIKDIERAEYFAKRFKEEIDLLIEAAAATPTAINAPATVIATADFTNDLIPDE